MSETETEIEEVVDDQESPIEVKDQATEELSPLEHVLAKVEGKPMLTLPEDLYIPPDAMEVILEMFEGPLDLLLYLIRRQNLDILNIKVADITHQYMEYIELMQTMRFELAAEYLQMAAMLTEIKSRMLLPRPETEGEEEEDPRAELIRRLQEYERIKAAAENLDHVPREERDIYVPTVALPEMEHKRPEPEVDLREVLLAFKDVLKRANLNSSHHVEKEALSVRERMSLVLSQLEGDTFVDFVTLFDHSEGRLGLVVTFLAILELMKEAVIELVQAEPFAPIYVRAAIC